MYVFIPQQSVIGGLLELKQSNQYSKFFEEQKALLPVPSKVGMVLLYAPAFIGSLVIGSLVDLNWNVGENNKPNFVNIASMMRTLHFGKRILESLFLHNYSGRMDIKMSLMAGANYLLMCILTILYSRPSGLLSVPSIVGIIGFAVGEAGNFYHHYLLANMRKGDSKKYVVPHGGLFIYVACPHYFFETN